MKKLVLLKVVTLYYAKREYCLVMLCGLLGRVSFDEVLNRLVGSLSPDLRLDLMICFGPTHPDQPFDEARCDSCCECHSDGQQ